MKKDMLGKILVAFVAAFILGIALVACDGGASGGNSGEGGGEASADAGVDPMMYMNKDGELEEGIWNYSSTYTMNSVYGDAEQTAAAIQLTCADGKFTAIIPDQGITPYMDEWEEFITKEGTEGTYTFEYDADGVPTVTFDFNGQTASTTVDVDYGEMYLPATLFDPEGKNETQKGVSHADLDLKFTQY